MFGTLTDCCVLYETRGGLELLEEETFPLIDRCKSPYSSSQSGDRSKENEKVERIRKCSRITEDGERDEREGTGWIRTLKVRLTVQVAGECEQMSNRRHGHRTAITAHGVKLNLH